MTNRTDNLSDNITPDPDTMHVSPAAGRRVLSPDTREPLPDAGARVPRSTFWLRRLQDGDVLPTPATAREPRPTRAAAKPA